MTEALTCVVCGEPISVASGEVVCWLPSDTADEVGEYDGDAYHLNKCEREVFAEVHCEI
jgi:hypothetical protein